MKQYNILCVIGTRPEALKMLPVIKALSQVPNFTVETMITGQHRELVDMVLAGTPITNVIKYDVMEDNQSLNGLSAKLLNHFNHYFKQNQTHLVIAQGDTTTTLMAGLASFYEKIPFAHIESGLRTSSINNPYPEEFNRRAATLTTTLHFCPTQYAVDNLKREGITRNVFLTGNTIIDTLYDVLADIDEKLVSAKKSILITCHRRENFGQPLQQICSAIKQLAQKYNELEFFFPVHPNPNVKQVVDKELSNLPNVRLSAPVGYHELVLAMKKSYLVLTDSGGLQEEAPALGKPVLVLREETERLEAVACGASVLVGTQTNDIIEAVERLLEDNVLYHKMATAGSPYGDGKAALRITQTIKNYYGLVSERVVEQGFVS